MFPENNKTQQKVVTITKVWIWKMLSESQTQHSLSSLQLWCWDEIQDHSQLQARDNVLIYLLPLSTPSSASSPQPDWEDKCLMMISDEFRTELENMFQIFLSWKIYYFHPSEIALWRCDALSCLLCILEKLSLQSWTCITLTWPPHTSLFNS